MAPRILALPPDDLPVMEALPVIFGDAFHAREAYVANLSGSLYLRELRTGNALIALATDDLLPKVRGFPLVPAYSAFGKKSCSPRSS